MFIIHSRYAPSVTMLVTFAAVLLAAVLCAPVAQDPATRDLIAQDSDTLRNPDTRDPIAQDSVEKANYEGNGEWHTHNFGHDVSDFISSTKRVGSKNQDVNKINTIQNTVQEKVGSDNVGSEYKRIIEYLHLMAVTNDAPDEDPFDINTHGNEIGSRAFLNEILRVLDEKLLEKERADNKEAAAAAAHTLNSLSELAEKLILRTSLSKEKGHLDIVRQFRRETIPEVEVDIDRNIYKQFSHEQLNLKLLYEKKGGVCTRIPGYRRGPIYAISKCPIFYPFPDIKHLCEFVSPSLKTMHHENIIEMTASPVQDVHGFVYRNVYCAQCQGAKGVQSWSTALVCEDMQQLILSDGQHDVTFLGELVDKNQGCRRVLTPAFTRGIHECPASEVSTQRRFGHETRVGENSKTDYSPFPLSFTLFMNFGFDGKTHILFSTSPTDQLSNICKPNEMYDPVNNKCRDISCTEGYQLVDGSCQKTSTYEYDPTDEDFDFSHTDEPLLITLVLRNISHGMAYMLTLPGMDELVVDALASEVDISRDRIQNLTLTILNNTEAENGTLKNQIEIHSLAQSSQNSDTSFVSVSDGRGMANKTNEQELKSHPTSGKQPDKPAEINDDAQQNDRFIQELISGANKSRHSTALTDSKAKTTARVDNEIANATDTFPEKEHMIPQAITNNNDSNNIWEDLEDCSVQIEFILMQAHPNTTIGEKSANGVIHIMKELIRNGSFMFTLNGTDFQIQSLENAASPESLDNFCTNGIKTMVFDQDAFTFSYISNEIFNTSYSIVYVNETGRTYRQGQYDLTYSFDGTMSNLNTTKFDAFVFVCDTPKIENANCPRIVLSRDEYHNFDNLSIGFANQIYNLSEYEFAGKTDDSVRVCAPDWSSSQRTYQEGKWALACGDEMIKVVVAESYLTFILGLISILSMLTVLITYSMFERLRNLPGVNTMNLTLSLFLGELVFILSGWIQPHVSWLCSGVGMLLHYLFLASFFWMNVMSYDVYRTFAKKCILRRIREKKKYVPRYSIYAWGSPLIIVGICAFLDFSDVIDGVKIGYGSLPVSHDAADRLGRNISVGVLEDPSLQPETSEEIVYKIGCWIQEPVASMVAFGGPMMLILLGNFVMFTRTIICIRASTKSTRNSFRRASLNHMAGRDDVMLYIRMSTVMGFTWFFGLASSIVSAFAGAPSKVTCITLHMLGILFIVLNCSQGIFIFFAFVCNRRVFALYRGLVRRLKENRKRPLSASSSRGTIYSVNNTSQSALSVTL